MEIIDQMLTKIIQADSNNLASKKDLGHNFFGSEWILLIVI